MITRRGILGGLAGILTSGFAPAAIGSGVLMPVRKIARFDPFGQFGYIRIPGFERYDGSPLWGDSIMGRPEYRAAQQELTRLKREMMDNVAMQYRGPGVVKILTDAPEESSCKAERFGLVSHQLLSHRHKGSPPIRRGERLQKAQ